MKVENKTKLKGFIAKTKSLLKEFAGMSDDGEEVNASSVELSDGEKLYFAEEALVVGIAVFSDEEMTTPAPDGEYTDAKEGIIVVTDGLVESITEVEAEAETDAQIIARLTTERDSALALASENETMALALGESLSELQAASSKFKTSFKPAARATDTNTPTAGASGKAKPKPTTGKLKDEVAAFKAARKEAKTK